MGLAVLKIRRLLIQESSGLMKEVGMTVTGSRSLEIQSRGLAVLKIRGPIIHAARSPEDQRKKTGRPKDTRPVIHGSRGPDSEDQRKKTGCPEESTTSNLWIQRPSWLDGQRTGGLKDNRTDNPRIQRS
jgi:hypothetical protein